MKRFIGNLRMSMKLMIAPSIATIFLLLLAMLSYKGLADQKQAMDDMTDVRFKTYQDASQMIYRMAIIHKDIFKILGFANAGTDDSKIQQYSKEYLKSLDDIQAFVANAGSGGKLSTREQEFFQTSVKELKEYEVAAKKVLQMAGADVSLALTMMAPLENRFQALDKKMGELLDYEIALNKEVSNRSMASYQLLLKSFGVMLGVAILLSMLTSIVMARMVTAPVKEAMNVVKMIADGDLTQEMGATYKDEIGQLAGSVEVMREKMADAVGQSVGMSLLLSEAASRQAASLEETSSSMEEMTSMTLQNANNTAQANQLMTEAAEVIRTAETSINELTGSMKEIAEASGQTQKIIKTIDEIAFQTNLLALNAAVEAARAGESGAGFAVVAEEVRNLALRAAESAKNTSALIEAIVNKVRKGETLVSGAYEAFQAVTARSSKVVRLVAEVAAASNEQSQGVDQINRALADMNVVTQQNAASAEELASIMGMFRTGTSGSEKNNDRSSA